MWIRTSEQKPSYGEVVLVYAKIIYHESGTANELTLFGELQQDNYWKLKLAKEIDQTYGLAEFESITHWRRIDSPIIKSCVK